LAQYHAAIANTQNISGMKDPLRVAILTGFLLCAEINKLKNQIEKEQTSAEQELDRIAWNLISCIDQAIEETKSKEPNILDE
jgi:cell division protein ZapA (FtsZ GTPase activity inhibitor)